MPSACWLAHVHHLLIPFLPVPSRTRERGNRRVYISSSWMVSTVSAAAPWALLLGDQLRSVHVRPLWFRTLGSI